MVEQASSLSDIAQKLARVADALEEASRSIRKLNEQSPVPQKNVNLAAHVRSVIGARAHRDTFFGGTLFADPAWDLLLGLFLSEIEGQKLTVSSACIAARVPPTTALRWINRLEEDGLIRRSADPGETRRVWLQLTPEAAKLMQLYFSKLSAEVSAGV